MSYKCDICHKTFSHRPNLCRHKTKLHPRNASNICTVKVDNYVPVFCTIKNEEKKKALTEKILAERAKIRPGIDEVLEDDGEVPEVFVGFRTGHKIPHGPERAKWLKMAAEHRNMVKGFYRDLPEFLEYIMTEFNMTKEEMGPLPKDDMNLAYYYNLANVWRFSPRLVMEERKKVGAMWDAITKNIRDSFKKRYPKEPIPEIMFSKLYDAWD
jgi:hypothetical protein